MFCPNCGREIPDGAVCPCTFSEVPLSTNPALHVIKKLGSSPLFLAMTICSTAAVVFALLANFVVSASVPAFLGDLLYELTGSMEGYYALAATTTTTSLASVVMSTLVSGIYAAAFWLHYVTCRSRASGNIATHGLTIWKVYAWISVVGSILAAVVVVLFAVVLAFLGLTFSDSPEPIVVILVIAFALLFVGVYFAFLILYHISKLRLIRRTVTTTATGVADPRVSAFLVVFSYIAAGFTAIGAIGSLVVSPLSAIATLADTAQIFCMALLLSQYRKQIVAFQYTQGPSIM